MAKLQCKQMDSKELIRCTFGLTKTELAIFLYLLKTKACIPSSEIADKIGLDRTTVQKSMKNLLNKDIVLRRQNNLDSGGFVFLYCVKKQLDLKAQMQEIVDTWKDGVDSQLKTLFEENN
ncbi:MAG: winged helix-turn-helix transcriptional regulator [Candidatus Diapherotrites archaeon]|jgi:predicted transcriptional regulator|nr:winged helix-turn-helix transcriptional regulator [Candidatus Diapherotrites archaeon]MBT4597362.1 winged helix-turn-helix transcriptional regulator [Candidatus Diapherotrites archaeon]